jgi:hypothetical protein
LEHRISGIPPTAARPSSEPEWFNCWVTLLAHTGHHAVYIVAIAAILGLLLYDVIRRRRERS